MTPHEQARLNYEQQPHFMEWDELLALYYHVWPRVLVDNDNTFLLARPVRYDDGAGIAVEKTWRVANCDTWFIWFFIGDIRHVYDLLPFSLPHVCYRRTDDSLHFHSFERLKRLLVSPNEERSQYLRPVKPRP